MPLKLLRDQWKVWVIAIAAGGSCYFLPSKTVALVSQELIALFGLLLAGALPTMILTATILRAGAFSPKRVGEYAEALESQLSFWFGLFVWALIACVAIMMSKALWNDGQQATVRIPLIAVGALRITVPPLPLSPIASSILGFSAAQVIYRLWPMLTGLRSLLRLNSAIAKEEAADKVRRDLSPTRAKVSRVMPTEGHGDVVE